MNELRAFQLKLTEILSIFHDFCVKHSLCYYAVSGTALGAARHKGFIPWDDDIDVGLPRPDYERFITIFNKENHNKRYILECPNSPDSLYLHPFSKIYDTKTTLIESFQKPLKRGIYLDIFPIDGAGNSKGESSSLMKKLDKLFLLREMRPTKISRNRALYKNCVLFLAQLAPNCLINNKKIVLTIDSLCKTKDYAHSEFVGNLMGYARMNEIVPKKVLGTPTPLKFEDLTIFAPQDIDSYLTSLYGNWRQPPPIEKQKTLHRYYSLDLCNSYLEPTTKTQE